MLRWLLVGSLVFGLGTGLRRGWIEVNWNKLAEDLNAPYLTSPEPLREFNEGPSKGKQAR
jgi:hypothetical protein